jgi:endoglucanase
MQKRLKMTCGAAVLAAAGALLAAASCAGGPARPADPCRRFTCDHGGIVRGDTSRRRLALVFTGGSFGDGGDDIRRVLREEAVQAAFFFTGDFYRTPEFEGTIRGLAADGHYLGAHSDKHLLYCPWDDRERTLVGREEFRADLEANFREMERFGIRREAARLFIPPYEWYNRTIAAWAREMGLVLFNFTPGTSSNADYTTPSMPEYLSSRAIYGRILAYEAKDPSGLNGFILLLHIGTDPERTDKFYFRLGDLLEALKKKGYAFVRLDELLGVTSPRMP